MWRRGKRRRGHCGPVIFPLRPSPRLGSLAVLVAKSTPKLGVAYRLSWSEGRAGRRARVVVAGDEEVEEEEEEEEEEEKEEEERGNEEGGCNQSEPRTDVLGKVKRRDGRCKTKIAQR
ncbi:hypothetical protein E2C01_030052 [Portunus trituberculatus]|uniref:Uncharacterized protein n=1 Tax=Portunus trituberculatus TaxID=210409 RepID=A0A5B7EU52_PORTR|nr:hypothetical protein [Portunus trituberculatus]